MRKIVCFIHVPRTAGTAIRWWVKKYIPDSRDLGTRGKSWRKYGKLGDGFDPNVPWISLGHNTTMELIESKIITREWYDAAWKFAFVRNTYPRLVSQYEWERTRRFRRRRNGHWSNTYLLLFEDFIDYTISGENRDGWPTFRCRQLPYLTEGVDAIYRYEDLPCVWKKVCEDADVPFVALGHRNAVRPWKDQRVMLAGGDWRRYYTDETREKVAEFFADEIERFGFEYE